MNKTTTTNGNYAAPPREINISAVTICLRKSFDFSGRGSRSEYWWFHIYVIFTNVVLSQFAEYYWGKPVAEYVGLGVVIVLLPAALAAGLDACMTLTAVAGGKRCLLSRCCLFCS